MTFGAERLAWFEAAGFAPVDEAEGDGYRHLLVVAGSPW
jgi:hypothetical protein